MFMGSDTQEKLKPVKPADEFSRIRDDTLNSEGVRQFLDRDNIRKNAERRVDDKATEIFAEADGAFAEYVKRRVRAEREYSRVDYLASGLFGVITGYAACAYWLGRSHWIDVFTPWFPLVIAALIAIRLLVIRARRRRFISAVPVALQDWTDDLKNKVMLPFILETLNELSQDAMYDTSLDPNVPPLFFEQSEPRRLVMTEALDRIRKIAGGMPCGSLGISGPRGAGKSTILNSLCDDSHQSSAALAAPGRQPELRMALSAPVDYEPREFILHLYSRFCEMVQRSASFPVDLQVDDQVAKDARDRLRKLRFVRTETTGWSAALTLISALGLTRSRSEQLAEQPFTLPELVSAYREYTKEIAAWWRSRNNDKGRVVIGIDEVDKILDAARAEAFLNGMKAVFEVPGCFYLISLSEDAMATFSRRALSIRTSFDSAFDDVVSVMPMEYQDSEELLIKRAFGLPRPFIALCHVLSGGLPRDLIRAARELVYVYDKSREVALPKMAQALVQRELASLRRASLGHLAGQGDASLTLEILREWAVASDCDLIDVSSRLWYAARKADSDAVRQVCRELAVSLSFYAAVLILSGPLQDSLVECLRKRDYALIEELAEARRTMRFDADLAHSLIKQYCFSNRTALDHDKNKI